MVCLGPSDLSHALLIYANKGSKQGRRKRARTGEARSITDEDEDGHDSDYANHAAEPQRMNGQYRQETGLLSGCEFDCVPARNSVAATTPRAESLDMHDLSSIVHPSHEPAFEVSENGNIEALSSPVETTEQSSDSDIKLACKTLNISLETLNIL